MRRNREEEKVEDQAGVISLDAQRKRDTVCDFSDIVAQSFISEPLKSNPDLLLNWCNSVPSENEEEYLVAQPSEEEKQNNNISRDSLSDLEE